MHNCYNNLMRYRRLLVTISAVFVCTLLLATTLLLSLTGFLRPGKIDDTDTTAWTRDTDGVIRGHDTFTLEGTTDHCWLLIHSFAATPDEMRDLATRIYEDFGDTVVAPRLAGHATLPSDLQTRTMNDWYAQVEAEYRRLSTTCNHVSVVGSSIGGALALRLAEDHELAAVYAINPYLYHTPQHWYYLAPVEWYMEQFEPVLHYLRRRKVAQIADPAGLAAHVAYYHLPVRPMTNSREFFATTEARLSAIAEPLLVLHSIHDPVSDYQTATTIYEQARSTEKTLHAFDQSGHILLRDYDQTTVIATIMTMANN
jgi:carboxylesterase